VARIRLLVVDDDDETCLALRDGLDGYGISVDTVCRPADALARIADERYDLVLSDVLMPDTDGIELAPLTNRGPCSKRWGSIRLGLWHLLRLKET